MNNQYCIVTEDGQYVGLDSASGGYPFVSKYPMNTYIFEDFEQVQKYFNSCVKYGDAEGWIIKKFEGLKLSDV